MKIITSWTLRHITSASSFYSSPPSLLESDPATGLEVDAIMIIGRNYTHTATVVSKHLMADHTLVISTLYHTHNGTLTFCHSFHACHIQIHCWISYSITHHVMVVFFCTYFSIRHMGRRLRRSLINCYSHTQTKFHRTLGYVIIMHTCKHTCTAIKKLWHTPRESHLAREE